MSRFMKYEGKPQGPFPIVRFCSPWKTVIPSSSVVIWSVFVQTIFEQAPVL